MALFEIIYGKREEPKENWIRYGDDVYTDPQEANAIAKGQNEYYAKMTKYYASYADDYYRNHYNKAFMIQRITGERDFSARETAREDYKAFEVQGLSYHFAELHNDKISFFASLKDAEDNRRTEMKLGRYLRRYTELHDNEIAEVCARNGVDCGDMAIQYARTRDEIANVYAKGPRSCMSSPRDYWTGNVHPTEAYASPDLAIAYIIRDDRITARTVVIPGEKKYVGIYGDSTRMQAVLEAEGYTEDRDALVGCRLLKCPIGEDRYAMPYIDSDGYVADLDEKYFIYSVDKGSATGEHGYVRECDTTTGHIEDDFDPYDDDDNDESDDWEF